MFLPIFDSNWIEVRDGFPEAMRLFKRHYSYRKYADGRNPALFCGPGEKLVLITPNADALFVWRKFKSMDGQQGINCAVFRNEGPLLSSLLITEAEELARRRWPGERLFTYINPRKIKSVNPGYCFKVAGWRRCGITKRHKLIIMEKFNNKEGV